MVVQMILAILAFGGWFSAVYMYLLWREADQKGIHDYEALCKLTREFDDVKAERDEALKNNNLTETAPKAQHGLKPPVLNSAQARKRASAVDVGFFSADRHISTSELLKEN
jgi:hypothetical protein